jgi:hypothetical protein
MPAILYIVVVLLSPTLSHSFGSGGDQFHRCLRHGDAIDWSNDNRFIAVYTAEDRRHLTVPLDDITAYDNNLAVSSGTSFDAVDIKHGCQALNFPGGTGQLACFTSNNCDKDDFCFIERDFTIASWIRLNSAPTATATWWGNDQTKGVFNSGIILGMDTMLHWRFVIDPSAAADEVILTSTNPTTVGTWTHVAARFTHIIPLGNMEQIFDGVVDSTTTAAASVSACGATNGGIGMPPQSLNMRFDDMVFFNGFLSDIDICRIAVCGIRGDGCRCDWLGTPANYLMRYRHSSEGGELSCTLPACDKSTPD